MDQPHYILVNPWDCNTKRSCQPIVQVRDGVLNLRRTTNRRSRPSPQVSNTDSSFHFDVHNGAIFNLLTPPGPFIDQCAQTGSFERTSSENVAPLGRHSRWGLSAAVREQDSAFDGKMTY